jgi:hypothetical protein
MVEVDIPINTIENYDDRKGSSYGEAMKQSRLIRGGGSYGMAGGFSEGPSMIIKAEDGTEAFGHEHVEVADENPALAVQTLGGRILPAEDGDPIYMLGAFRNSESSIRIRIV